jgi:hypothetical protein
MPACTDAEIAAGSTTQGDNCIAKMDGGRRRTLKAKTLRRMLKKKGMKTTGKKATLMKRLHMKGGMLTGMAPFGAGGGTEGGRRRRTRRSRKFLGIL